jgi:predicted ATPase
MSELAVGFQSLPEEFQKVIRLAQDLHKMTVTPLQILTGGFSGASIYLVSVASSGPERVEHYILKLDRKSEKSRSDEIDRYQSAIRQSPAEFADEHIAKMAFERVEHEGFIAIFYAVAGQSLNQYRTLSAYERQSQLEIIFSETYKYLLDGWNAKRAFRQAVHPVDLLEKWLGFRLKPGNQIETFLETVCRLPSDLPGFLIQGGVFPNPLAYARNVELWGKARPIDAATGLQHGDLNANNILVKFNRNDESLDGFYLIDFAMFKEAMPLLYDLRYLEMSYLILRGSQVSFEKLLDLIVQHGEADRVEPHQVPIDVAGVCAVIGSARGTFERWVKENHPSLQDDLWGQYWLAGVAGGLAYCHKPGLRNEERLAALAYAAANLKRYAVLFGISNPSEGQQLYDPAGMRQDKPARSSVSSSAHQPLHNLPAQPTPFIGRGAQIAALKELVLDPDVRLVTLMGPGGTGKTRLSLQVAQAAFEHFPDGVIFVPLADDIDSNQFISRVAQHLEVREGGRPLLENLKDYLREKHLLLVLDNFEQLVSASPVVAELLVAAPQLKVMVTSRIALELHGEHEFPVPPLELPHSAGELTMETLAGNESVRLFVERARAVYPNFRLTDDNGSPVAEICRRLDGLPLALELAAARIKLLPPQAILSRLDDRLKLLTGGARDLPARQQTLRNTLEWSYSLLNEEEKTLYARLSVFVGGFSLEAAEAVCNSEGRFDILEGLTSLVNNSLLRQEDTSEGEPRFGMLETIRAYAIERLAESGEMEPLRQAHAQYFGNIIINQAGFQLYSEKALYWLNWLEREHDNIRATLNWSLTSPGGIDLGPGVLFALTWFWYRRGYSIEGSHWAEQILASPIVQATPPLRVLALQASGMLALWQGKQDLALSRLQEGLAIEQRLEDDFMVAALHMASAIAFINMGRDSRAQPLLEIAQKYFKENNQPYFHAITIVHLGNAELGLGHPDQARALHEEARTEAYALGESWILSFALNNLGEVARTQGQYDLAKKYYKECEALLRNTGDKGDLARFVHSLGYIAQHEGDTTRAESQFRKSLALFRQLGNRRGMAECMAGLAGLKARQGETEWGAVMLSAAESVLKITGGAWWPADRVEVEANQEIIRSALSEAELAAEQKKGRAMTLEQALAFATEHDG